MARETQNMDNKLSRELCWACSGYCRLKGVSWFVSIKLKDIKGRLGLSQEIIDAEILGNETDIVHGDL